MPMEIDKWGWKHVSDLGGFSKGSGTKKWKCHHCDQRYNGSYSRVRAHLLGFHGMGVKPCPMISPSLRESFRKLEEERLARKRMKKKKKRGSATGSLVLDRSNNEGIANDIVARFFFAHVLKLDIANSQYFRDMVKSVGSLGSGYKPPSVDQLLGDLFDREKSRIEKMLALARDSWPHTGCSIICANRVDGSLGCLCVNFFVASTRGVMFLKEVDIIEEGDGLDDRFINELSSVIVEVGPLNVFQVITRLEGQASQAFATILLSKFPHIFWSHCTSHSILLLMEEMAEIDWIKSVVSQAKQIDQSISASRSLTSKHSDPLSQKFAPSYSLVRRIFEIKGILLEIVTTENLSNVIEVILSDEFWGRVELVLEVFESFLKLLATVDVDKSVMGDLYNWRIMSLEALKGKNISEILVNQIEILIENTWGKLFSPLHEVAYIINPSYFGRGQNTNKSLKRTWNTMLERYEANSEGRIVPRQELESYWKTEGCFGEMDAVECVGILWWLMSHISHLYWP